MTKNPIKKIAVSLINNSFTENFIPFLKAYNRPQENSGGVQGPFTVKSQSIIGKGRLINNDSYSTSFSQKIKKAESEIIKQYFRQLEANFPQIFNLPLLSDGPVKNGLFRKDELCTLGAKLVPLEPGQALQESQLMEIAEKNKLSLAEKEESTLLKKGYFVTPSCNQSKNEKRKHNFFQKSYIDPIFFSLEKKSPFTVLLSVEHIRNAILSKRSVVGIGQTEKKKSTRQTRFHSFSDFKKKIYECRKVRLLYGNLSRKDLHKSAIKAKNKHGTMGENLLLVLETRLDVTLYRCGFFPTIKAARQSILHRRIQINNVVVDAPSYQMQVGDIIKIIPLNVSANFLKGCVRFKTFFQYDHDQTYAAQKNQNYFHSNSTKNLASAQWVNNIVNARSLRWRYPTSATMIWYLLQLQYNILLPLFKYGRSELSNKLVFFSKAFVKTYYKSRLDLSRTKKSTFSCKPFLRKGHTDSDNSISFENALNNLSKVALCSYIGSTLDNVLKTLSSIARIVTNRQVLFIHRIKNQVKRHSNNNDYDYHFFFHLFCYSLLIQKKLISLLECAFLRKRVAHKKLLERSGNTNKAMPHQSSIEYKKHIKKSKALHLEVSYASLCAIYLYTPQRIYFPVVLNLDILRKIF